MSGSFGGEAEEIFARTGDAAAGDMVLLVKLIGSNARKVVKEGL